MKSKKLFALMSAVLMLCGLAACAEGDLVTAGDNSDWVWVPDQHCSGAIGDTGFYYVNNSVLCYADFAAEASTVLCSKAGCSHGTDTCDADIPVSPQREMWFSDGRLYYFDMRDPVLYSRNATGVDLKKIGTVCVKYIEEQKAVSIGRCGIAGGYLYYEADISANVAAEDGVHSTKLERECIGRIDLSTGKDEILIEQIQNKQTQKLYLSAVRANGVLLFRMEGNDADREDPNYAEAALSVPVTLEYWNGETGETTVLFRKTINECSGIKMVSNGKVYYKTLSYLDAENAGYTYSHDLNTGKEETVCAMNARAYLGGSYVQCTDPETQKTIIYDMASGQKLPYDLEKTGTVYNAADNGFVVCITGQEELIYYFVSLEALKDGLQQTDLVALFTRKMGYS